jgi:cytochrome c-type biogenesis protein CcmH
MVSFVLLAAALAIAAVLLVAIPLLRKVPAAVPPASWAALSAAALLVVGSALLYVTWSNWSWGSGAPADSPAGMGARLARELEHNPQNLEGWLMLGHSYTVLQEYPLAVRAFERADRLSGGRNADALVGEAQALALGDESELDARAGRLIERALVLDPESGKALFFGAALAQRRGDLALARERFTKLLSLNPPENIRPLLAQQISAIDARLAAASGTGTPPMPAAGAPPDKAAVVRVNVTLAPALAAAAGDAPLFVFVRDPHQGGPPLAVKRLGSHFPQSVALGAADSMIPGRFVSAGQSVQVVARIARSGSPVGTSGDPFGEVTYHVGQDGLVTLVIDRLTP